MTTNLLGKLMKKIKKTLSRKTKPEVEAVVTEIIETVPEVEAVVTETIQIVPEAEVAHTPMEEALTLEPVKEPVLEPVKEPSKHYLQPVGTHHVLAEASVGLQHRNMKPFPLPCQDAVSVTLKPRPILVLCDGAGSASVSEVGSTALTLQISRLCKSIEPMLPEYLDTTEPTDNPKTLVRIVIRHAMGVLEDLSHSYRRDMRDFRSTLNFALVGTERILWIRVGDGELVQEKISYLSDQPKQLTSELYCLGEHAKGEYANQTQFIDQQLRLDDVQWGLINSQETTGLALMSDGATEKLVANARDKVSGQITDWLENMRQDKLKASDLCKRFYSEDFNRQSTGDDRSVALWAREFN